MQAEFYEQYRKPVAENCNGDSSALLRIWLPVQARSLPSKRKIYAEFKEYVADKSRQVSETLQDLKACSQRYALLQGRGESGSAQLDTRMRRMRRAELLSDTTYPFLSKAEEPRNQAADRHPSQPQHRAVTR